MAKILSIGAGVMGTAITIPASTNGHNITLVGTHLDEKIITAIQQTKLHPELGVELENTNAKKTTAPLIIIPLG